MDEVEIIQRVFEAPTQDPEAQERARARLRDAMAIEQQVRAERRRRPLWRKVRWLGTAAAIVAVVVLAQRVFTTDGAGSASADLRRLAATALSSRPIEIPEGSFLYLASKDSIVTTEDVGGVSSQDVATGRTFDLVVRKTVETWLAADGSGKRITTIRRVSFLTDEDRQTWREMGRPEYDGSGTQQETRFKPGELTLQYDLSQLPTDPASLLSTLRAEGTKGQLDDRQVMSRVAYLLSDANPSSELRAALFQVLADLPGIESLGSVQDPAGRTGMGILLPDGSAGQEYIFDPSTSAVLAILTLSTDDRGAPPQYSRVFTGAAVVDEVGVPA